MTEPRPLTLTIEACAALLGVSRTTAYAEARTGTLAGVPVLRVGRRLLVPRAVLERALGLQVDAPTQVSNGATSARANGVEPAQVEGVAEPGPAPSAEVDYGTVCEVSV